MQDKGGDEELHFMDKPNLMSVEMSVGATLNGNGTQTLLSHLAA